MIALNLISLLLISIVFISIFSNKYVKTGLSALLSIFFCLEVSSLYIGGSFIDYKYYLHFNSGVLSMSGGFIMEIFLFFLLLIALSLLFFFASNISIFEKKRVESISKAVIFIVCLAILIGSKGGIYDKLKEIHHIASAPTDKNFDDLLKEFGFTSKENLEASSGGKNIIIISLESFEKAFLHDKNRELTPHLRKRKESWTFYEMKQNKGSEWTSGSLYTVFTGLPSFFIGHPNLYLEGAKENKLISFGDILNQCGYESYHLSNNAAFAGTKDILTIFGVNHILDGTFGGKYKEASFGGVYDKDIFTEAKEILEKRTSQKPFMLFISTTQVHTPDGWLDDRMLQLVEKKETNLETVALSTDWLVEDFISFLENKNLLENTVVYLFPDHLFMGWKEIFKKTEENRGLWFMTNAGKNDLHIDSTNFYQIDLLPNILSGAKIKHNAKFLSGFIEEDKGEFIEKNGKLLTSLNTAAVTREKTIGENFSLSLKNDKLLCTINRGEKLFAYNTNSLKNTNVILCLNKELKVMSENMMTDEEFKDNFFDYYYTYIKISVKDTKLHFEWVRDDSKKQVIQGVSEINLDQSQLAAILKLIAGENINNPFDDSHVPYGEIKHTPKVTGNSFVDYLPKVLEDSSNIVIISCYDEGSVHFGKLRPVMEKANLKESLTGKFRWSYLAVFSNHKVYCEKTAENKILHKKILINEVPVYLTSTGMNSFEQNIPFSIIIDGKQYAPEKRGLNIVVFDAKKQEVVDTFNVDSYGDEMLKINRDF